MKFLLILLLLFCSISYAENWSFNLSVDQDLSYDDNVTMSEDPQESLIYNLTPALSLLYKTESIEIQSNSSYGIQRYTEIEDFDSTQQAYSVKGTYFTERTSAGLSVDYSIAPSRDTAVQDSGDFGSSSDKETRTIAPFISYTLTESDNIFIETLYTESTSSEGDFGDNEDKKIDLAWQRQWTQRYDSNISVFFSQFEFSDGSSNADINTPSVTESKTISNSYGINFSSTFVLSEQWSITSGLGARMTETTEELINNEETTTNSKGFLTDTSIKYTGDYLTANLAISRSLVPSTRGQLDEQSKLNLDLAYQITEKLSASFLANYQISIKESSDNGESERENIVFESSVNWEILQGLIASGSYRYNFQEESDDGFSTDSNLFMLSIGYEWPGHRELK